MRTPLHVLLVDDSPEFSLMVQEMLQLTGEFEVDVAESIKQMWTMVEKMGYDAIMLDYQLPDQTGLEALDDLSERPFMPPVVMITGVGDEKVASQAIKRGAYEYVVKGSGDLDTLPTILHRVVRLHAAQMAQQKAEEQALYQAWLLDNVSDAVVAVSPDGRITFWNNGATSLFGIPSDRVLGSDVLGVLCPDPESPAFLSLERLFEEGSVSEEFELKLADGRHAWINARTDILKSTHTGPSGRVGVFRDITERKNLEAQVQSVQARLLHAARLSALGELASSLAHQINNPLTTVIGEAQILAREIDSGTEAHKAAQAVQEAGWRASRYVKRLMDLATEPSAEIGRSDVNASILAAAELVGNRIEQAGTVLRLSLAVGLPPVAVNERDLLDLWLNLLLAARDAIVDHSAEEISVVSSLSEGAVEVFIQFPGKLLSYRWPRGPDPGAQIPLGLAIGKELIRQAGGTLEIRTPDESQQEIRVLLPLASPSPDENAVEA